MQALICTGGRAPRQLPPSLTAAPAIVICADSGYQLALSLGLTPNWLVGDLDSLPIPENELPPECQIERYPREKDYTDSELALHKARQLDCHPIILVGGGGLRVDHFLALVWLFEGDLHPHIWITDSTIIYWVVDNWSVHDLQPSEVISILPVGVPPWKIKSQGLHWKLDKVHWKRAQSGISNHAISSRVTIEIISGALLVLRHIPPLIERF